MEKSAKQVGKSGAERQSVAASLSEGVEKNSGVSLQDNRSRSVLQRQKLPGAQNTGIPVAQLTKKQVTDSSALWTRFNTNEQNVNTDLTTEFGTLNTEYTQIDTANGGVAGPNVASANNLLERTASTLLHDVSEIESHAGGYLFQQQIRQILNTTTPRDFGANQYGATGGKSNTADPDIVLTSATGKEALEVKRTTTASADPVLKEAIAQVSKRRGYNHGRVFIQVTDPALVASLNGAGRGGFQTTIENNIGAQARAWESNWWNAPGHIAASVIFIEVKVKDATGTDIFHREYKVESKKGSKPKNGPAKKKYKKVSVITTWL